ncbi:hypothetical protein Tco_0886786 [Tanacetum coccineum]
MSTQQDIYAAGSENRPPMLNKDNYVPWSSLILLYEKSDPDREVPVAETFHEQTDDELTDKEVKQMEADDQAIQTILMGLSENIYVAERFTSTDGESIKSYYHHFLKLMNDFKRNKHFLEKIASNLKFLNNLQPEWRQHVTIVHQTKDLHEADYTQLYDFLKFNQVEVNKLRAERLARTHDPLALMANSNNPYNYPVFHQDRPSQITYMQQPIPNNNYIPQPSFNQNYMQQPMLNPKYISDPTTAMNMALVLMAKAFKLNYSTPTNNNQIISSNPCNRQIAQPGMNIGQDRQMQMVGGNGRNQFRQYVGQNVGNQNGYNALQNVGNQNANQNGNGNVVAARAKGNGNGNNGNQEEARIQLEAEEFDLMAATGDLDEIKEVNANCILMVNLQQASTSGTQTDKYLVYDSDGSVEVHYYDNFSSVEQSGGTVEQNPATVEETRALYDSLYNNLAI